MTARILDGKTLAATMQAEIAAEVAKLSERTGRRPGLATVLVGDDPASHVYVRNKRRSCEQIGMTSFHHELPASASQPELLSLIERLNGDEAVHGILVQLPLPRQIDEALVTRSIASHKDVDCFHPENVGLLSIGRPRFKPCTPHGVQQLIERNGISVAGRHVVIVGRSNIVGKPLASLLMQKGPGGDATVTVAHSRSADLPAVTRSADIVIVAIGQARFLTAQMVRPGAVVIDVGMNRTSEGKLCGDVEFAGVSEVAAAI